MSLKWIIAFAFGLAMGVAACGTLTVRMDGGVDSGSLDGGEDGGFVAGDAQGDGNLDAGKLQRRIDASGDCGVGWNDGASPNEMLMCCGGNPCKGWCYEPLDDDSGPFCTCNGATGGCPTNFICCRYQMTCDTGDAACP
jgi:hypothetical protein